MTPARTILIRCVALTMFHGGEGDEFFVKDGICHKLRFVDVVGKWEIKNNQLCPSLTWKDGGTEQCWYFVMLLNRLALFDGAGNMLGNEKTLTKGKALSKLPH